SRVRNLLALRRSLVGQSPQEADKIAVLKFANASINFITFEVTIGNRMVRLTHLEMNLLRYFAENEGRVIPRSELLQNVWGLPGTLQTRAPDQFMSRLRKTFEPIPAQPKYFLTIRDAGYRFVTEPDQG
ncbi:MAG: response regulator transcription factor, partial [Pirellulales bacterium]|nr:response regulator transcription factor [Pirellulales bacterium]